MNADPNVNPESLETDFSLEDEYKPDPLAPQGTYRGHIIQVSFDQKNQAINWIVALQGNAGVMSDGETPIDGQRFNYQNWLPRIGDENIPTPSGRTNKRQAKINMLKQFADAMQINMDKPTVVAQSISEGLWLGIPVIVKLGLETYEGRTRNRIERMARDKEGDTIAVPHDDGAPF
jgi:hypothetical protein